MAEEDDELYDSEGHYLPESIQSKIEDTIKLGLDSNDLATKMKAATLAAKMGLVKGIDRNIKVSETAEMVTDIILYLSLVHGWEIRDLVRKMYRGCPTCRRLGNKFESPKVIR